MASNTKWLFAICLFGLAVKINRVATSQEVMKKLTLGFAKALDQCKTEVRVSAIFRKRHFFFISILEFVINRIMINKLKDTEYDLSIVSK